MLNLKRKAAVFGMAAVMLMPGAVYGQSKYDTYCRDWTWLLNHCLPQIGIQKPEIQLPEIQIPETGNPPVSGDITEDDQNVSAVVQEMLEEVNAERRKAGLSELALSAELSKVAQVKAEDMRDSGYFSHTSPNYGSPFEMMKEFGISYKSAGENIAKGQRSVDEVMNGWMNSSGHRANILSSNFTELGVGYCTDNSGNGYWVQMFIRR